MTPPVRVLAALALGLSAAALGCGDRDGLSCPPWAAAAVQPRASGVERQCVRADGTPHGPAVVVSDDGARLERGQYRDGQRDGVWRWYHANGRVSARGTYVDGALHGPFHRYDDGGRLFLIATYARGDMHGPVHKLYPNGRSMARGQMTRNRKTGDWIYRDPDGAISDRRRYDDGRVVELDRRASDQP